MSGIIHKLKVPKERQGLKYLLDVRKGMLRYFVQLMNKEGAFAWTSLGGKNVLMLNDAAGIEHVLKTNVENYHKSHFYSVLRPLLGNSVLLSEGEIWRKQRRESAPVFINRNFESMVPQMVEATEAMIERWQPSIEAGNPIDLNLETVWLTLDILLRTLFHEEKEGIAVGMQQSITAILREAEERIWSPLHLPQSLVLQLPKYRKAFGFLEKTLQELVAIRNSNKSYPEDLLSRLIANYGSSPEEQKALRDQVMTFLLAGHETTANGLVWAFYYLSLHPDVTEKLAEETDSIVGEGPFNITKIKDMTYTQQVFDEVLRIHPIVWTLSRDAMGDDLIPLEDGSRVSVPKGSVVQMCTFAVHRRDLYWKNPEAFDPSRFSPSNVQNRPRFSYFPFGGGPRQCIGFRFAQIESVIVLAMISRRFSFELVPGQDIQHVPNITLRPNGPMLFYIKNRRPDTRIETKKFVPLPEESSPKVSKCPFH